MDSNALANTLRDLSTAIIPILFAITIHEVSHGYAAYMLGDNTAKNAGRLTLNPLKHIDIVGLLCLIITRIFGWAKPVPINFTVVSRKKHGILIVALAGPVSNYLLAIISVLILKILVGANLNLNFHLTEFLLNTFIYSVAINVMLGTFNLIPIPPLDGSRIILNFLPPKAAYQYSRLDRYGFLIVFAVLLLENFNIINIISPLMDFMVNLFLIPLQGG